MGDAVVRRGLIPFVAAGALLLPTGCVQLDWERVHVGRPLDAAAVERVLAERPSLEGALAELGAPNRVRRVESRVDRIETGTDANGSADGEGTELLWVWRRGRGFSLTGSVPIEQGGNASLEIASGRTDLEGLRLVFDLEGRFLRGDLGAVDTDEPDLGLPFVN